MFYHLRAWTGEATHALPLPCPFLPAELEMTPGQMEGYKWEVAKPYLACVFNDYVEESYSSSLSSMLIL